MGKSPFFMGFYPGFRLGPFSIAKCQSLPEGNMGCHPHVIGQICSQPHVWIQLETLPKIRETESHGWRCDIAIEGSKIAFVMILGRLCEAWEFMDLMGPYGLYWTVSPVVMKNMALELSVFIHSVPCFAHWTEHFQKLWSSWFGTTTSKRNLGDWWRLYCNCKI